MTLLTRLTIAEPVETWPGMKQAAERRLWDGLILALGGPGYETGAIYLMGYVAEMLLKSAYFQVTGVPVAQNIASHLQGARTHASWRGGNLHNLRSWFALLNDVRFLRGVPWSAVTAATVARHVFTVDAHWRESLRYSAFAATEAELNEVFISVDWLHANYDKLWRLDNALQIDPRSRTDS